VTSVGNATSLGSFTSAQLITALTDETGSGSAVFSTSPTLVTPVLGTPQSGNFSTGTFTWPTFNQNTSGTAAGLSATLAIASGGTAATTAASAIENLLPAYTGNGSKALKLNSGATALEWVADGGGTVTSVAASVPSFLSIAGSPITTSGTLAFTLSGTALPTTSGGTGLTSFTSGGVVYASSSSALATGSALTFNGTNEFKVLAATGVAYNRTESTQYSTFAQHFAASGNTGVEYKTAYRFVDTDVGELMRLTSTGLGIGTSSIRASSKLDVRGDVMTLGSNATYYATIDYSAGTGLLSLASETGGSGGIRFLSGTTELARITAAGNLGLGVTPSAWQSSLTPIQGLGYSLYSATATQVRLSANEYFNAGSIYRSTGVATLYQQSSGQHQFFTAASGTAGNAISFTQAMTLTAAGDLGIGTTSPSTYSANLAVFGSGNGIIAFGQPTSYTTLQSNGQDFYLNMKGTGNIVFRNGSGDTERARITAGGYVKASNTGTYQNSSGPSHEFDQSADSVALQIYATNASYATDIFQILASRNTTNNTFFPFVYYNLGASAYKFRMADSGSIGTAGSISLGSIFPPTSGIGVQFPATQSASSDANTLDDYEEGTWEAALVCGTSGTITLLDPSTTSLMRYTKVGRVVTVSGQMIVSSVSSPVGALSITGLPFAAGSGRQSRVAISVLGEGLAATAVTALQGRTEPSSSVIYLSKFSAGANVDTLASDVTASTSLYIGGTYTV
jgi:hypothetical protein